MLGSLDSGRSEGMAHRACESGALGSITSVQLQVTVVLNQDHIPTSQEEQPAASFLLASS